jgi:hypothetical protein
MNLLQLSAVAVTFIITTCGAIASPVTMVFDVQANPHVWNNGSGFSGNLGLSTDITFDQGDSFSVIVNDIDDTWNFCPPNSSCTIDADGNRASGLPYGIYTSGGGTFNFGALVGRVTGGDFFHIGTAGFVGTADAAGELSLFHWDFNTNNSGSIGVTIAYDVTEPSILALFGLGLVCIGFARSRRS